MSRLKNLLLDALALSGGLLLPFAFAPYHLSWLAFVCPASLFFAWHNSPPKRAFWRGLLFGLGFFGFGVHWIYISVHVYGNTSEGLATLVTALFTLVLSLFIAMQGYVTTRYFARERMIFGFPSLWVIFEGLRSYLFTGFPWLLLGYSQIHTPLAHIAPLLGVYGVSLAVVATSSFLVYTLLAPYRMKVGLILLTLFIWVFAFASGHIRWTHPLQKPIKVSLIQGNIPQTIKWVANESENIIKVYDQLTKSQWDSNLIVWPESAIPKTQRQTQRYIEQLHTLAKQNHTTLITGITIEEGFQYYNGMIMIGRNQNAYLKRQLVPFGEYLPFRSLLYWLPRYFSIPMSGYTRGAHHQHHFIFDGVRISPSICYEVAYGALLLNDFPEANLIVSINDDSWFGRSIASAQHLQITQMRALEVGRYAVLASNTGITAIINPDGTIKASAPQFTRYVLTGIVYPTTGHTPLMVYHYYLIFVLCVFLLILALRMKTNID